MKKIIFACICGLAVLAAGCKGEQTTEESIEGSITPDGLKGEIMQIQDSLRKSMPEVPKDLYDLAISKNMQYFDHFPEDDFSAECLDRVQGYYNQLQKLNKAVIITDTLLARFPDYKGKKELMYNRAVNLDLIRDTARARAAYQDYLKTFPNLSPAEREDIEELIKLVPYSIEERIKMNN
jgi:tetratricopeptide (TPR) repeat protein